MRIPRQFPGPATLLGSLFAPLLLVMGQDPPAPVVPGTRLLTEQRPLDEVMVAGIDRFALSEIASARGDRNSKWHQDYSSPVAYQASLAPHRERFAQQLGVVDNRLPARGIELIQSTAQDSLVSQNDSVRIDAVRWPVLDGVSAEGLLLRPKQAAIARVVALPDADWTPEMIAGLQPCDTRFALDLALSGCEVLVPTLINRDYQFSSNDSIGRKTNLTHREFIYRQAFELGRHIIGYEVQKVLSAVDQFEWRNQNDRDLPIVVAGVSEGGLLALYATALDTRIDASIVSGYFDQRENVWKEPIYRNVWGLLNEFGDAEIAGMIAPRFLSIEVSPQIPEVSGPPQASRNIAAPGAIVRPDPASVLKEIERAKIHWQRMSHWPSGTVHPLHHSRANDVGDTPLDRDSIDRFVAQIADDGSVQHLSADQNEIGPDLRTDSSPTARQQRQVQELVSFTQRLLALCHRSREQRFANVDRSSLQAWQESIDPLREQVYAELFGRLPSPQLAPDPRTRLLLQEPEYSGYEVVLDVYPDVIASGILLLPTNMRPDEKRPVVVCQHGLEGTPMDTITGPESKGYRAYKAFSAELAKRGFIVYAPQNPYRGRDRFRTLQRKSNPLARSLFSYIIPQHLVTLRWLSTLSNVDPDRIGFYGLSYGGKTAVRVPPMLPPTDSEPGYCLSICSADFNEWVAKNASSDARFSYLWTGEYEIFEWNMGHVANYAELSMLMAPRPFMVERGHDDGVGIDEWVAWEYAKVRRTYNKLGIGDRTEIEFFDGPHTINGQGTYQFLHRHLKFP